MRPEGGSKDGNLPVNLLVARMDPQNGMWPQLGCTRFAPGGPAIVGEFGPELVNVPRGSSIAPASETRKALGGDTHVHITNTFQGPVDQSVMPAFEDTMKRTAREVHAAIRSQHLNLRADRTGKVLSAAS